MIFIGGIHGVGKTFFCSKLKKQMNVPYYSSSELISNQKKEQFNSNKKVKEPEKNQDFLIDAIKQLNITNNNFLLDGHFCLLNSLGNIVRIPEETFIKLSPEYLVVLINNIEVISNRLLNRDNHKHDPLLIEQFQNEELKYSQEIAEKLDVPLYIYNLSTATIDDLYEFISESLTK